MVWGHAALTGHAHARVAPDRFVVGIGDIGIEVRSARGDLCHIDTLPDIGSDHLPLLVDVVLRESGWQR